MEALYETWNPCFPLRRAYILLFSWVSKPIQFLSQRVFWVVVFHSFIWWFIQSCFLCSLFCTLLLSWCLLLLKLSLKNQLFMNSSKLSTILRPRAKFAITNYDSLHVSLLCFLYSLQVELYNSELSSIMIYVLMNVMLNVRILLSTLHSINLRPCLLSSVSLGDKRSLSLGGVDTSILHHYYMS